MGHLRPGVWIHLLGIGGIGLSAIARVLRGWGYDLSGSDRQLTPLTSSLEADGIRIFAGHSPRNLMSLGASPSQPVVVVASSAIPPDNVELAEARRLGFPVLKRREMLTELTRGKRTLAVAGTHGKTTTSAMIAWILTQAGRDPTFIVGGILKNLDTNAAAGTSDLFVIEADEYDRAFLGLSPDVAVITTVEHDHPDCYPAFADVQRAFSEFAGRTVPGGRLVLCGDEPEALRAGASVHREDLSIVTYGTGPENDWQAVDASLVGSPTFLVRHQGKRLGTCALQLPGHHNVLNSLAALAVCAAVGVDLDLAAAALTRFKGTARRFELKGQAAGITVVDDYAHHPTEIRATLEAARARFPGQTVWAVFQPHTFSRTATLLEGFATTLSAADHVVITPIYAARERNELNVSGADIAAQMAELAGSVPGPSPDQASRPSAPADVCYVESLEDAVAAVLGRARAGDVVLTLGAGDVSLVGEQLLERAASGPGPILEHRGTTGTRVTSACWS